MNRQPISNWIETTRTHFHAGHRLVTWHPRGILDDSLVDEIAYFTQTLEQLSEAPFELYTDLSGLSEIHLAVGHIFTIAEEPRLDTADMPPVKSAFFCDKFVGFGLARMYEALMEGSAIDARAFRGRGAAAAFLGVQLHVLDDANDPGPNEKNKITTNENQVE